MVYGRTAGADVWWRVRPPGIDREWLESAVYAVIADGRQLQENSRFLITVRPGARLVGVACQAAELSKSMHSDGTREMYCFVGWFSAADTGGPELPDLYESYPRWAGATYEHYMRPVWNAPVSQVRRPHPGQAGPPPWPVTAPPAVERHIVLQPVIHLDDWDIVWNHALAASTPARVVLGWKTAGRFGREGVTHLGVLDRDVPRLDRRVPHRDREAPRADREALIPSLDAPAPPPLPPPVPVPVPRPVGASPPAPTLVRDAAFAAPHTVGGTGRPRRTSTPSSRATPILLGGAGAFLVLIAGAAVFLRAFDGAAPTPSPTRPFPTPAATPATPVSPPSGTLVVAMPLTLGQSDRKPVPGFEAGRGPWLRYSQGRGVSVELAPRTPALIGRAGTLPECKKDVGYRHPADLPHVAVGVADVTCVIVPGKPDRLAAIRVNKQARDTAQVTVYVWEPAKETD
ncbi:hypothetical protein SAMN05421869_13485 [Nonomuraea jiangxiensis]|uniref:Uncharacterized protein n=1 Tax=Nonomuraea jiangxiensis TaxID=633440 RepID=A0A1G9PU78_9ACTN|nr:hypothetical protein SAMN05421869_13485 [Nonomuraea jiangxiensis]